MKESSLVAVFLVLVYIAYKIPTAEEIGEGVLNARHAREMKAFIAERAETEEQAAAQKKRDAEVREAKRIAALKEQRDKETAAAKAVADAAAKPEQDRLRKLREVEAKYRDAAR